MYKLIPQDGIREKDVIAQCWGLYGYYQKEVEHAVVMLRGEEAIKAEKGTGRDWAATVLTRTDVGHEEESAPTTECEATEITGEGE